MRLVLHVAVAASVVVASTPAEARMLEAKPSAAQKASLRFNRGTPTLQIDDDFATVTVTPLKPDHGRMTFAVAAFNKNSQPFNLGIESVKPSINGATPIKVLSKDELVKKAKNRAMWSAIAMATLTSVAAAGAASSAGHHYYTGSMATPHGYYRYSGSYTNTTEQWLAAGAVTAAGAYTLNNIQNGLDNIVANLEGNILQTTTVDQGAGYGGVVVVDKFRATAGSAMAITINANGRDYPFLFDLR